MYHLNEYELIKILLNKKVYTWKKVELAQLYPRDKPDTKTNCFFSLFRLVVHATISETNILVYTIWHEIFFSSLWYQIYITSDIILNLSTLTAWGDEPKRFESFMTPNGLNLKRFETVSSRIVPTRGR